MYKEALIRNTYQGILANRPRDLTEEEEEALELQKLMELQGTIGGGKDVKDTVHGPPSNTCKPTELDNDAVMTPIHCLAGDNTVPLARLPNGLPPLSGGSKCVDSPMSRTTNAPSTPHQPWRPSGRGGANTASTPDGATSHNPPPISLGPCAESGSDAEATAIGTTPQTANARSLTPSSLSMATITTGGLGNSSRLNPETPSHSCARTGTDAASVFSWVADNEDEFYDQLDAEPSLSSRYGFSMSRTNTGGDESNACGEGDKRKDNRRNNNSRNKHHVGNSSISDVANKGNMGHKGGRVGKKRGGNIGSSAQTSTAAPGRGGGGGSSSRNAAPAAKTNEPSGGRFDSLLKH